MKITRSGAEGRQAIIKAFEVLRMQVMEALSAPELKSRGLSHHLHYFIEKMMAKEADVRYQSWAELISDIKEQLAGRESLDYASGVRSPGSGVLRRRQTRRK